MQRYRNQVLAGLLFITLVLIGVVAVTGAGQLVDALQDFPAWLFVPVFGLKLLNWLLRYVEWRYFLGVIGVQTVRGLPAPPLPNPDQPTVRERDSFILWMAGLTLSISPGKLAEVLKALVLKNLSGIDFTRSAPVIFMERLVDGLAVIPLTTLALLAMGGTLEGNAVSLGYVRAVLLGVSAVLVAGMILVQIKPLAHWALDRLAALPLINRLHAGLRNLYDSTYDLIKLRHLLPTVTLGIAAYTTDCIGFYILLRGLDVGGGWGLFWQATFILGFSVIIASLSALPGGAGGRELTIGPLLISLVGLSKTTSGTATFLIGLFQLWIGVLIGLVLIALFRHTLFPPALAEDIAAYHAQRDPQPG